MNTSKRYFTSSTHSFIFVSIFESTKEVIIKMLIYSIMKLKGWIGQKLL